MSSSVTGSTAFLAIAYLALAVAFAPIGVFVIVVVANRAEPDPTRRRPAVVYRLGVAFVTVWLALAGSAGFVASLVNLIGSHSGGSGLFGASSGLHPIGDAAARGAVLGGLVCVAALVAMVTHLRSTLGVLDRGPSAAGPAERVLHSYVSAVSFVSIVLIVTSIVAAGYLVCQLLAPGVFQTGAGRVATARYVIDVCYVGLASAAILVTHRGLYQEPAGPEARQRTGEAPAVTAPPEP